MIDHIRYTNLETNRSDEIYESTFWCYFNSHGDSTRMVHDPFLGKKKKRRIPVTIAAKVSLRIPTGRYKRSTPTGWVYVNFGNNS